MPKANDSPRVFTTVSTLVLAGIYAWGSQKHTFGDLLWPMIILGSSLFLQWNPLASMLWRRLGSPKSEAWAAGPAGGAVVGLIIVVLTGMIPLPVLSAVPALYGFGLAALGSLRWAKETISGRCFTVVGGVAIGIALAAIAWGVGYQHVDNDQSLSRQISFSDPLFHAAIANMIHTHHVPTTGIDGLTRIPYHVGSHWFVSVWSGDSGIGAYELYPAVMGLFFVPLELFGILCMAGVRAGCGNDESGVRRGFSLFALLPLLSTLPGIIPMQLMEDLKISNSFWASESACLALGMGLCSMALVCDWYQRQTSDRLQFGLGLAILLPALIAAVLINKISVGAIMIGMAGIAFLRTGLWKNPMAILSLLAAGVAYVAVHKWTYLAAYGEQTKKIIPFAYWKDYFSVFWWPVALPANIFWACLTGFWLLKREGISTLGEFWTGFRSRRTLGWELLTVAVVLGLLPGLAWRLLAGAAGYFHDCQRWLAVGLLTGLCWRISLERTPDANLKRSLSQLSISKIFIGALLTMALAIYGLNLLHAVRRLNDDIARTHGWLTPSDPKPNWDQTRQATSNLLKPRKLPSALGIPVHNESSPGVNAELIAQLNELYKRPLEEKRKTLLLIPRTNRAYWDMLNDGIPLPNEARRLMSVSFVAPALTGFAMVNGIPEYHPNAKFIGYGLELFAPSLPVENTPTRAEVEATAKQAAESWGFRRILVLDHSAEHGFTLTVWEW